MNGTMEEPMETSSSSSPVNHKTVAAVDCESAENHCENTNDSETSNDIDCEPSQDPLGNSNAENSANENGTGSGDHQHDKCDTETLSKEFAQKNSNNDPINHCGNSNQSYSDSVSSPLAKSETAEQVVHCIDEKSFDGNIERPYNSTANTNIEESDEVDSEEDSSDDDSLISEGPKEAEDAVSINSDSEPEGVDETSQESQSNTRNSDIIILENDIRPESQNGNSNCSPSPEVHEIPSDTDDCIATDEKSSTSTSEIKQQLRRSSRAIKRKRYGLDNGNNESDIEEVEIEDPLSRKTKPIVINDTKGLVEMAAKQIKYNQKKEPTIVIIDTHSGKASTATHGKNTLSSTDSNKSAQSLYQSIVARGTTVTPVSSKSNSCIQSSPQHSQPSILPSLTDDMFVVEAPSFIVPYVYEKPSIKPFKEFVNVLGKELEEQRAKEEKERLEKDKKEKEKREQEKQERRDRGEEVEESADEAEKDSKIDETEDEKKKKKAEKRERRRRKHDDDDASWDGDTSADSEDETISDDETFGSNKEGPESVSPKKDSITDLSTEKLSSNKSDNYFDCSLGKFFVNIGLNMVQEFVQNDLLKQQSRKLYREKKSGHSTKATETSIASLMKNLEFSKENNAPYAFPQKKCEFCSFKTESMLAMNHHLETPHMKNNLYKCNFCAFEIRSPHDILYHMEAEHNSRGKLERAPAYHQCPNCPFEDNGKGKLARHLIACAKKFKPELNLAPPIEWEPPAKIPKIVRARSNMVNSYQNVFSRQVANNMGKTPINIANMMTGAGGYRPRGRSPLAAPPRASPAHGAPVVRGGVMLRHNTPAPVLMPNNYPLANNGKKSLHQPSISITPLPRQPQPVLPQPAQQSKSSFVICEICDGYIKDLEQLRNHMQWIHKVKIHPKMIYNRPPLNCQKCQFRFFTDQGLERHLLGSHGLVTSSMQEAANKGKDAGRCPVCGRVYQWKLLSHVAKDHNLTLKPAHLSYKCTVCTATFGMYKQFENHVYSAHSVVAKRVMDKSKTGTPPAPAPVRSGHDSLLKPLKINDEITIIPQPVKQVAAATHKHK